MQNSAKKFYPLRVYKHLSTSNILNLMLCNKLMKSKFLVKNAGKMYKASSAILGQGFTNAILNQTFCKALTAGNTFIDAEKVADMYRKNNISVMFDYCAQGQIGKAQLEESLDQNARIFAHEAQLINKNKDEMISVKLTGLVDMHLLKKLNDAVLERDEFWNKNSQNGIMNGQQFFEGLQKKYSGISDAQFQKYLETIHNYKGQANEFKIDEIDFKMKHAPFYIGQKRDLKNSDFIIHLFFPLNSSDRQKMVSFTRRIDQIFQPSSQNQNQFKIIVDAQQSYVQLAIQTLSEQLQQKYNKNILYVVPTIQNYLKRSVERTQYEIEIAKRKNLIFGAKLVRGAYIVEQTKLSTQNSTENPIVNGFDLTTQNYLKSFKLILEKAQKGQIVVATHNQDTINSTSSILESTPHTLRICYAQLLGLADHLTFQSKNQGFKVYKYLPWAKSSVMIGYMIRRAQQLSMMKYPLDTQFSLLKHELETRYIY